MKNILLVIVCILFIYISSTIAQELTSIQLPPPQVDIGKPLMQVLMLRKTSRNFDSKPIPLQELSNLLWAANGINRPESGKRTAPSAMNWQETDIYVIFQEGAYIYEPKTHKLIPVVTGDLRGATGMQEFIKEAPVNLVYVADETRMPRVNDDDKKLYSALDVGFIAQNVYLYCASQGFAVVVRGSVDRPPLAKLLKLRNDQRIIVAQTVGYPK